LTAAGTATTAGYRLWQRQHVREGWTSEAAYMAARKGVLDF